MRILITGISGFSGRALAKAAQASGATVIGVGRSTLSIDGVMMRVADLLNATALAAVIADAQPTHIIHLAADTPARVRNAEAAQWLSYNPQMTLNLCEAVRQHAPDARVLIVSSSAVYGHVSAARMPIHEDCPLHPTTMYGVSKATQELIVHRFIAEHGLHAMIARPFNLVGPGEPAAMLTSVLATQVAVIAAKQQEPVITLRHRATARDYTDIRDAVRAYLGLVTLAAAGGVYNVCTGDAVSIGVILDRLIALAKIDVHIVETAQTPARNDIIIQQGDNSRLRACCDWQPEIDLNTSLADLLATFSTQQAHP